MNMQHTPVLVRHRLVGMGLTVVLTIMLGIVPFLNPAWAATTRSGATGLILTPSADTLNARDTRFAFGVYDGKISGSLGYGLLDTLEIGVNSLGSSNDLLNLGIFAKVNVVEEDETMPAIAIGAESRRTYVVASKRLMPRARGHLGYAFGRNDGIFGGVAVNLNTTSLQGSASIPPTTLMAELAPNGDINAGIHVILSPMWSTEISMLDMRHLSASVSLRSQF